MNELDCAICFNSFGLENRAMLLPCDHTMCFVCIEQIPKNFGESKKKCPFCRREFDVLDCRENFEIQEVALLSMAKEQSKILPFTNSSCSKCERTTRYPDFFCCFSCHPTLMKQAKAFNPQEVQKTAMCPFCVYDHLDEHNILNQPSTVLPLTIFTATSLLDLKIDVIFSGYTENPLFPAFTFDIISSVLDRQEAPVIPKELIEWLAAKTEEFIKYVEDLLFIDESIGDAVLLFGRSLWKLISSDVEKSAVFSEENSIITALFCVQRVASVLTTVIENPNYMSFTGKAAAQEFVWDECLSVIMNLWQQIVSHDNLRFSPMRITSMKRIINCVKHVFYAVDTREFLEMAYNEEIIGIDLVASDASTTVETQAILADYRMELEHHSEEWNAVNFERICLLGEEKSHLNEIQ